MGKLTTLTNRTEDGRRGVVGEDGGALVEWQWRAMVAEGRFGRGIARPSSGWGGAGVGRGEGGRGKLNRRGGGDRWPARCRRWY